jgi:hypothetical protein|tara:strand:- start:6629 stop:7141 length:513 start_codon:yes stop_codon:yes gene_type:complete
MLHTIVVDNFFDNVDDIISLSKKLKYYKASESDNWPGLRTKSLHDTHYNLFNSVIIKILNYYYPNKKLHYSNSHVVFSRLKYGDEGKTRFHLDDDTKIAAVIYLSEGNIEGGTTIFENDNKKQIIVGNIFNSMIAYDGNKLHGYTSLLPFKNKERLTLNVFIGDINDTRT